MIRGAVNKADNEQAQESALTIFLRACLQWILDAVEFFTRFTSNFVAITGESFCTSASMTYDLLTRNMLSTVLVEVISDRLLAMVTFVLTVAYALLVSHIVLAAYLVDQTYWWMALLCFFCFIPARCAYLCAHVLYFLEIPVEN